MRWLVGGRSPSSSLSLGEGSRPGAGCGIDLRRAERGALLPTPARRSRLPFSKFPSQAGTLMTLLVRTGERKK